MIKMRNLLSESSNKETTWKDSKGKTIKINDVLNYNKGSNSMKIQVVGEADNGGLKYKIYEKFRLSSETMTIPPAYKPKYFGYLTIIKTSE